MPLGVPPIGGRRPDNIPKSPCVPAVDRDGAEGH